MPTTDSFTQTDPSRPSSYQRVRVALREALRSGIPGMAAMGVQVSTLMWLRTIINYQYRYGTSTAAAAQALYKQGGISRFYSGFVPALLQGPLSRFGDTAANAGTLSFLNSHPTLHTLPITIKTFIASSAAAVYRIALMPIDTVKTVLQVEGSAKGWATIRDKVSKHGPSVLYHGSLASSFATFMGHYPWFTVYNFLDKYIPHRQDLKERLARNAAIGFIASAASDTCSNSIRVIKTTRQASSALLSYTDTVRHVVEKDGVMGLMGRGLRTKIFANGIQGLVFSVLWRLGQDKYREKEHNQEQEHKQEQKKEQEKKQEQETGDGDKQDL